MSKAAIYRIQHVSVIEALGGGNQGNHLYFLLSPSLCASPAQNQSTIKTNGQTKVKNYCTGEETIQVSIPYPGNSASAGEDAS